MRTETRQMYITEDGQYFEDRDRAEQHEAKVNERKCATSYYQVFYNPDLTEGRGNYSVAKVKVYSGEAWMDRDTLLQDFLVRELGRPVRFVMGCKSQPTKAWHVSKMEYNEWRQAELVTMVGDMRYNGINVTLILGDDETGLIIEDESNKRTDFKACKVHEEDDGE